MTAFRCERSVGRRFRGEFDRPLLGGTGRSEAIYSDAVCTVRSGLLQLSNVTIYAAKLLVFRMGLELITQRSRVRSFSPPLLLGHPLISSKMCSLPFLLVTTVRETNAKRQGTAKNQTPNPAHPNLTQIHPRQVDSLGDRSSQESTGLDSPSASTPVQISAIGSALAATWTWWRSAHHVKSNPHRYMKKYRRNKVTTQVNG